MSHATFCSAYWCVCVCVCGVGVAAEDLVVKTARHKSFNEHVDEHLSADLVVKTAGPKCVGNFVVRDDPGRVCCETSP